MSRATDIDRWSSGPRVPRAVQARSDPHVRVDDRDGWIRGVATIRASPPTCVCADAIPPANVLTPTCSVWAVVRVPSTVSAPDTVEPSPATAPRSCPVPSHRSGLTVDPEIARRMVSPLHRERPGDCIRRFADLDRDRPDRQVSRNGEINIVSATSAARVDWSRRIEPRPHGDGIHGDRAARVQRRIARRCHGSALSITGSSVAPGATPPLQLAPSNQSPLGVAVKIGAAVDLCGVVAASHTHRTGISGRAATA
jgi:hypothetical protein